VTLIKRFAAGRRSVLKVAADKGKAASKSILGSPFKVIVWI
jgi:hypothetical protein